MDFNEILRSYADFNIKLSQAIKEEKIEYICASHISAQTKIIQLREILKEKKYLLFGEAVSAEKLEQQIKELEQMSYCDSCKNKEKCANFSFNYATCTDIK